MSRADPLRVADYLRHILEAIDNIQTYTAGLDLAAFMADRNAQCHLTRLFLGGSCHRLADRPE
jgi:uncharacterized protein with HEPN domain